MIGKASLKLKKIWKYTSLDLVKGSFDLIFRNKFWQRKTQFSDMLLSFNKDLEEKLLHENGAYINRQVRRDTKIFEEDTSNKIIGSKERFAENFSREKYDVDHHNIHDLTDKFITHAKEIEKSILFEEEEIAIEDINLSHLIPLSHKVNDTAINMRIQSLIDSFYKIHFCGLSGWMNSFRDEKEIKRDLHRVLKERQENIISDLEKKAKEHEERGEDEFVKEYSTLAKHYKLVTFPFAQKYMDVYQKASQASQVQIARPHSNHGLLDIQRFSDISIDKAFNNHRYIENNKGRIKRFMAKTAIAAALVVGSFGSMFWYQMNKDRQIEYLQTVIQDDNKVMTETENQLVEENVNPELLPKYRTIDGTLGKSYTQMWELFVKKYMHKELRERLLEDSFKYVKGKDEKGKKRFSAFFYRTDKQVEELFKEQTSSSDSYLDYWVGRDDLQKVYQMLHFMLMKQISNFEVNKLRRVLNPKGFVYLTTDLRGIKSYDAEFSDLGQMSIEFDRQMKEEDLAQLSKKEVQELKEVFKQDIIQDDHGNIREVGMREILQVYKDNNHIVAYNDPLFNDLGIVENLDYLDYKKDYAGYFLLKLKPQKQENSTVDMIFQRMINWTKVNEEIAIAVGKNRREEKRAKILAKMTLEERMEEIRLDADNRFDVDHPDCIKYPALSYFEGPYKFIQYMNAPWTDEELKEIKNADKETLELLETFDEYMEYNLETHIMSQKFLQDHLRNIDLVNDPRGFKKYIKIYDYITSKHERAVYHLLDLETIEKEEMIKPLLEYTDKISQIGFTKIDKKVLKYLQEKKIILQNVKIKGMLDYEYSYKINNLELKKLFYSPILMLVPSEVELKEIKIEKKKNIMITDIEKKYNISRSEIYLTYKKLIEKNSDIWKNYNNRIINDTNELKKREKLGNKTMVIIVNSIYSFNETENPVTPFLYWSMNNENKKKFYSMFIND